MKNNRPQIVINIIFSLLFFNNLNAKNVDFETAQRVAVNYFSTEAALSKTVLKIKEVIPYKKGGEVVFRIFNFEPIFFRDDIFF